MLHPISNAWVIGLKYFKILFLSLAKEKNIYILYNSEVYSSYTIRYKEMIYSHAYPIQMLMELGIIMYEFQSFMSNGFIHAQS